jgi:hypothetical protein
MTRLTILTPDDMLAEIRRLYFSATRQTIADDFFRALQLLKSMNTEEEREKATVYMEGLNEMRADWAREGSHRGKKGPAASVQTPPAGRTKLNRPEKKDRRRGR